VQLEEVSVEYYWQECRKKKNEALMKWGEMRSKLCTKRKAHSPYVYAMKPGYNLLGGDDKRESEKNLSVRSSTNVGAKCQDKKSIRQTEKNGCVARTKVKSE
jgi:hypothetical protein